MTALTRLLTASLTALLVIVPGISYAQDLDQEMIEKINAALPDEAPVEPKQDRKLLIFTLCKGFVHSSIPYGAYAIEEMGKRTGAYSAVISDDPQMFAPDNINQFDAVLMLNTTGTLFEDETLQKSFLDYVKSGKGLVGIHAATDCFYDWHDYGQMMGGYFWGHPWNANNTVTVKLDDPAHPINAPFNGRKFDITDEIYQFQEEPYSRETHRVLLSLDTSLGSKTDMTKKGIRREDGDFAVAWVKTYGDGRVFYCSLGHNEHIFWDSEVLRHYLRGIQFAFGDLEADTTPSAKLPEDHAAKSNAQAAENALDQIMAELEKFDYEEVSPAVEQLENYVTEAQNNPELREKLLPRFNDFLKSDATLNAKWIVAKHVNRIGGNENVEALSSLLSDAELADPARYALQRIDTPEAHQALVDALAKAEGDARTGLINACGQMRLASAVPQLGELLASDDAATIEPAARALGRIATPDAARAINEARPNVPAASRNALTDALFACGETMAQEGSGDAAAMLYATLDNPSESLRIRRAALAGLGRLNTESTVNHLIETLQSDNKGLRMAAASALVGTQSSETLAILAETAVNLEPDAAVSIIHTLARQGDPAALDGVTKLAKADNEPVRKAAIAALGDLGNASTVPLLANVAASGSADAGIAEEALAEISGANVPQAIRDGIASDDAPHRIALIDAAVARQMDNVGSELLTAAKADNEQLRVAAYDALGKLGSAEALPDVLALLVSESSEAARNEARAAAVAMAARVPEEQTPSQVVINSLKNANKVEAKAAIYHVLARIGDDASLDAVKDGLESGNPALREASIRALAEWPTPEPMLQLLNIAENADDETLRIIAYRGFLNQAAMPSGRSASKMLDIYKRALDIAPNTDEKKKTITALADVMDKDVFAVVKPYLESDDFKKEAEFVIEKLNNVEPKLTASHNPGDAKLAMDGDIATRWATGGRQEGGEWFLVDLGWEKVVTGVSLDTTPSGGDYPRTYKLYLHRTKDEWGKPVATGEADKPVFSIETKPIPARFVRIVNEGETSNNWWSIHELKVHTKEEQGS